VSGPVPDFDLKTEVGDPADALLDRQAAKNHLGTNRKREHRGLPRRVVIIVHKPFPHRMI
jgi:hypothetical protein